MKTLVLAALLGLSIATTGAVSVQADTITVHGFAGAGYGR